MSRLIAEQVIQRTHELNELKIRKQDRKKVQDGLTKDDHCYEMNLRNTEIMILAPCLNTSHKEPNTIQKEV